MKSLNHFTPFCLVALAVSHGCLITPGHCAEQPACQAPVACDDKPKLERLPVVVESPPEQEGCDGDGKSKASHVIRYYSDYANGFRIRAFYPDRDVFDLKINGWIQVRHHAFARDVDTWTDQTGTVRPVRNRNAFDIERARLIFSGHAVDKRLTYFLQLDGDTDGGHNVDFFDYWWGWQVNDSLQLQLGKRKVPASRQWLLPARETRLVDRPLSNDFFRPDRTVGLFAVGKLGETGHYELMVGNGYQTANLPNSADDNRLTFAATNWFDPLGDYGRSLIDYDDSDTPLLRVGHSFVFSPQRSEINGITVDEANFVRLTDGTRLLQTGALAPGVTVSAFDAYLYGVDAAWKWQGWSFDAEVFFRWIEDLRADAPLPHTDLLQRGYYVEGGRFLIPKTLDVNFRYSQISGLHGDASEYAAGFNWFPLDNPHVKLSFDVTRVDGSPWQNTSSDILVGDDGMLFRTQFQAEF